MFKRKAKLLSHCLLLGTLANSSVCAQNPPSLQFIDSTDSSGLNFVHSDGVAEKEYLVGIMSAGLATLDFDNDGLIDAYLLSGSDQALSGTSSQTTQAKTPTNSGNGLFRNLGQNKFSSVAQAARVEVNKLCLGLAVADFDNDGFKDIAVSGFQCAVLLRNQGDGTFLDVTNGCGLANHGIGFGAGVAFLDANRDGNVDLYIADYVTFRVAGFEQLASKSFPYPPGPEQFEHRSDHLYMSQGDGRFADVSQSSGIASVARPSMGMVCGDFDQDNDTDIFVGCDARPNLYFVNDGAGNFTQQAELAGLAVNGDGVPVGSMGAEPADVDGDLRDDILVTDYSAQVPILFHNLGDGNFEDASSTMGVGRALALHAKWGAVLSDFDNDGDRDLMIAAGHLFKRAHEVEQFTDYKVRNYLARNRGKGRFEMVAEGGPGMAIVESSRGLASDDLDNDGDIDCVVLNHNAAANYLENKSTPQGNWIDIELSGKKFNRDGIGARVTVQCGSLSQVAEVRSGRGYQSSYGWRLHFGVREHKRIDHVTVNWLGKVDHYENLEINRVHRLDEK